MSSTPTAITQGQLALDIIGWVLLIALLAAVLYALVGVLLLPVWGLGAATGARRLRALGRGWWSVPWRIADHANALVERLNAPRDPEHYARHEPEHPRPRERDAAANAGTLVLWGLAIVGGLLLITTGEQHIVEPLAGGNAVALVTVAAFGLTVALAAGAFVLFARYPRGARPPLATFLVAGAIVLGFFSYSMLTEWQSSDRLVGDYCAYGAVSHAQLDGCKGHVTANQVRARDTTAAHFAQRDVEDCGSGAGPFCEGVVDRRYLEDQQPPPGQ
ncbi:MAG: hypothetical protein QOC78_273 [Solirubrobacteraceae bacterium]|jgi:hypothetical protein|nr:hypothetical protein [Solirubrobacteraceae bacterium]